jgi:hypothetical protein
MLGSNFMTNLLKGNFSLKGGGVSDFWDFRGFVRLDKCRLDIFETYNRKIYLSSRDYIRQFNTTPTNHLVNRG